MEPTYTTEEVMRKFNLLPPHVVHAIYEKGRTACPDCGIPSNDRVSPQSWAVVAYEAATGVTL
jgi:hypothetical protein